jgi:hypothetical protein
MVAGSVVSLFTKYEAPRIAANIAKLPQLLARPEPESP